MKLLNKDSSQRQEVYNGLDASLTIDLWGALQPLRAKGTEKIYLLEKALRAPILMMQERGIHLDTTKLPGVVAALKEKIEHLESLLQEVGRACVFTKFNPRSDKQLKELFYDALGLPPYHTRRGGSWTISVDRKALESFAQQHLRAKLPALLLLKLRDLDKDYQTLSKNLTEDLRWLASFNPAGTDTGRWSSSQHPLWLGANLQNIGRDLKHLFVPPPGRIFVECDLKGAESRAVAYLSGCEAYISAVESANIHASVAQMIWGIDAAEAKKKEYYRGFTYYDMAKRGGHLSNYLGTPPTMATSLKLPRDKCEEFQRVYFHNFPGLRKWHSHLLAELQRTGQLTTPYGRRRLFWERTSDDSTLRKAVAFVPQSLICDVLSEGILNLYTLEPRVWLHAQVHDSILMSVAEGDLAVLPLIEKSLQVPLDVRDINGQIRKMIIPPEALVGRNWGKKSDDNPLGLASPTLP